MSDKKVVKPVALAVGAALAGSFALASGAVRLTYAELNRQANQLGHDLVESGGAAGGPPLAIWMDRSPWMVVAVAGVLKAGLAYRP